MNAEAARVPLRELTARRSLRAAREFHGATDSENCARVLRMIAARGPGTTWAHVRRFCEQLPAIVRAEAQTAWAVASDLDPSGRGHDAEYRKQIERARILTAWAEQCAFVSTQDACAELVRRAVKRPQP